jgi:hypothetical protein
VPGDRRMTAGRLPRDPSLDERAAFAASQARPRASTTGSARPHRLLCDPARSARAQRGGRRRASRAADA